MVRCVEIIGLGGLPDSDQCVVRQGLLKPCFISACMVEVEGDSAVRNRLVSGINVERKGAKTRMIRGVLTYVFQGG